VPKDTRTRFQGIYARHRISCALHSGKSCNCKPSYWGKAWDRAAGKPRKTKFLASASAARNARYDLERMLRSGMLPASSTMRLTGAIETFLELRRNSERDRQTIKRLDAVGWTCGRVWEHEKLDVAVECVLDQLADTRPALS
jgi:hypothetical protein